MLPYQFKLTRPPFIDRSPYAPWILRGGEGEEEKVVIFLKGNFIDCHGIVNSTLVSMIGNSIFCIE